MRHGLEGGGTVLVAKQAGKLSIVRRVDALLDEVARACALVAGFGQRKATAIAARLGLVEGLTPGCQGVVANGEHAFLSHPLRTQLEPVAPGLYPVGIDLEQQAAAVGQLVGLFVRPRRAALGVSEHGYLGFGGRTHEIEGW